jgi:hypothetical protein
MDIGNQERVIIVEREASTRSTERTTSRDANRHAMNQPEPDHAIGEPGRAHRSAHMSSDSTWAARASRSPAAGT